MADLREDASGVDVTFTDGTSGRYDLGDFLRRYGDDYYIGHLGQG